MGTPAGYASQNQFTRLHAVGIAALLGLVGCFLPLVQVGALGTDLTNKAPSVFALAEDVSALIFLLPGAFVLIAVVSYMLINGSIHPRSSWMGLISTAGGFATGLCLLLWVTAGVLATMSHGFGGLGSLGAGSGTYLPTFGALTCLVSSTWQMFVENGGTK